MDSLIGLFQNVTVYKEAGKVSLHKPLLLLLYLGFCQNGRERLIEFAEVNTRLAALLKRYHTDGAAIANTHYPFGKLENDKLWEVEQSAFLQRTSVGHLSKAELIAKNIKGGFTESVFNGLKSYEGGITKIVHNILDSYFPVEQHGELLDAVGLLHTKPITIPTNLYRREDTMDSTSETCNLMKPSGVKELNNNYSIGLPLVFSESDKMMNHDKPKKNGYIDYLNSLSNVSADGSNALAESQALNEYFGGLYEPFPLAETIKLVLLDNNKKDKIIVLTGHAGDGKSTIALDIFKHLKGLSPVRKLETRLQEHEQINVPNQMGVVHIIKDMSELAIDDRVKWLNKAFGEQGSWLIVSNTGPLLESFKRFVNVAGSKNSNNIDSKILEKLNLSYQDSDEGLEKHVIDELYLPKSLVILNMTRLNNVRLGARILQKMLEHSAWGECYGCTEKETCPLQQNRQALQQKHVIQRVRWIYQRITEYEKRLTLRQMVAHLAFALTGGMNCQKVHVHAKVNQKLDNILFSESFFGYQQGAINSATDNLVAVEWTKRMDFGSPFEVFFERKLLQEDLTVWLNLPEVLTPIVNQWQRNAQGSEGSRWRFALRRLAYIYGVCNSDGESENAFDQFQNHFLQSALLRGFDKWQEQKSLVLPRKEKEILKSTILRVLLEIYSGFRSGQFKTDNPYLYLTLRRPDKSIVQATQLVLASLSYDDFSLDYDDVNNVPCLNYKKGKASLRLTLPLLDYINACGQGSLGNQLAPIHSSQLEWFRSKLLKISGQNEKSDDDISLLRARITGEVERHKLYIDSSNGGLELNN